MAVSIPYPSHLSLATLPTPLHPLVRFSKMLGGPTIWIKRDDLTGSILTGNKVRKLEFTLAHAITTGHDLIISCGGLQSNHCRATAFCGASLGLPVHLLLRGKAAEQLDGNLLLDKLAGATIDYIDASNYQSKLDQRLTQVADQYRGLGYKPYIIPTGASNGVGVWGYFSACEELAKDFKQHKLEVDLIVIATGSGGTQAGLSLGASFFNLGAPVLGMAVCDDSAYFYNKVHKDLTEFYASYSGLFNSPLPKLRNIPVTTNDAYIGKGYGIASEEVIDTIVTLAKSEGILLDPVYTGKAFYGLVNEIKNGELANLKNILFIHTGGCFGVFPYKKEILRQIEE